MRRPVTCRTPLPHCPPVVISFYSSPSFLYSGHTACHALLQISPASAPLFMMFPLYGTRYPYVSPRLPPFLLPRFSSNVTSPVLLSSNGNPSSPLSLILLLNTFPHLTDSVLLVFLVLSCVLHAHPTITQWNVNSTMKGFLKFSLLLCPRESLPHRMCLINICGI